MYLFFGILIALLTLQWHTINTMDISSQSKETTIKELSQQQNDLITIIMSYKDTPHRISIEKFEQYHEEVGACFNREKYPHHYTYLKNELTKLEIDKSISIISMPNKNKLFDKQECITEIRWLAAMTEELQKKNTSLYTYCTTQIYNCKPKAVYHFRNDEDFIQSTHRSLQVLQDYNNAFITLECPQKNSIHHEQSINTFEKTKETIKNYLTFLINVSDAYFENQPHDFIIQHLTSCEQKICALYPTTTHTYHELNELLKQAYNKTIHNYYASCIKTIQKAPDKHLCINERRQLSHAERQGNLQQFPHLYAQFAALNKQLPSLQNTQ